MAKTVTIYVPIDRTIQRDGGGSDHAIALFEHAISRETYEKMEQEHADQIQQKIKPIVDDIQNLIDDLENDNFDYYVDGNTVTIYHAYCPTLDRDTAAYSSKDYKGMTRDQKVDALKTKYIASLQEEINKRKAQCASIIEEFVYHPLIIDEEELLKMMNDLNATNAKPASILADINLATKEDNDNENG